MDAYVDVHEILPPYDRQDDKNKGSQDDNNKKEKNSVKLRVLCGEENIH